MAPGSLWVATTPHAARSAELELTRAMFNRALSAHGLEDVTVLVLPRHVELQELSQATLARLGLQRGQSIQ